MAANKVTWSLVRMIALVILLFALFASLFGISKATLAYSEPFFLIGSRMLLAGVLLTGHQFIFNRKNFSLKLSHCMPLFLLGLTNIYLTNVGEIWGLQHMSSSKVCLIYSLFPFVTALFAYFALRETLNSKKWLGLCVGFFGLIPIFMTRTQAENIAGEFANISFAEMAALAAVFCNVYGWILLKKVINDYQYSPLLANGLSMTLGGTLALLHSYVSGENWTPIPVSDFTPFLQNTLWMCLISNIICYNLYGYLLKRFTATFMAFAGLVTPFFATFFGWVFLNETITWHYYASICIFSIGLAIFYQEDLKKDKLIVSTPSATTPPVPQESVSEV